MNQDEPKKLPKEQKWSGEEVAKHNNDKDCWLVSSSLLFLPWLIDQLNRVIIHGKAYDVTEFKEEHPGGKNIILRWAGKDATETYEPIHPPDTLDK